MCVWVLAKKSLQKKITLDDLKQQYPVLYAVCLKATFDNVNFNVWAAWAAREVKFSFSEKATKIWF